MLKLGIWNDSKLKIHNISYPYRNRAVIRQVTSPFDKNCYRNHSYWRLTSNWTEMVNILSMGENIIHPLNGIDKEQSIKSTISILPMPIAPWNWFSLLVRVPSRSQRKNHLKMWFFCVYYLISIPL